MSQLPSKVLVVSRVRGLAQALSARAFEVNGTAMSFVDYFEAHGSVESGRQEPGNSGFSSLSEYSVVVGDPGLLAEPPACSALGNTSRVALMKNVSWIQSTWAGVNPLYPEGKALPGLSPDTVVTRLSGVFGPHMGEYVLGQVLAHERGFASMARDQAMHQWNTAKHQQYRPLSQLTVGVLGSGDIGGCVGRYFNLLGAKTLAVRRTANQDSEGFNKVYVGSEHIPEFLSQCDYVVNVLPSTPETRGLLGGDMLSSCKKGAVFVNVGRGDVISESDLVKSLDNQWISSAILDVTEIEPLPESSPLWDRQDVTLSPHCSAVSFTEDIVTVFERNINAIMAGGGAVNRDHMLYVVRPEMGY